MHKVGIICEYNPLHAGHAHLLQCARREGTVICVMSGAFTQRGKAAILPPVPRAAMAIASGADLVVELPFPYAAASARYFATAAVRVLAGLGCDTLAFGSESADLERLTDAARRSLAADNAPREGLSPAVGDAAAHFAALGEVPASNDILAIEYIRAILAEDRALSPMPVLRVGDAYREGTVHSAYPSATALRAMLARGEDVSRYIPPDGMRFFEEALDTYGVADTARLGSAMLARLRAGVPTGVADCSGGLAERLVHAAANATDYESLLRAAATKRYTDGRIARALLFLLACVTREDLLAPPAYVRLLAANERGREHLAKTRKTRTVPLVTKQSDAVALGESAARQRTLDAIANGLFSLCLAKPVTPSELALCPPYLT